VALKTAKDGKPRVCALGLCMKVLFPEDFEAIQEREWKGGMSPKDTWDDRYASASAYELICTEVGTDISKVRDCLGGKSIICRNDIDKWTFDQFEQAFKACDL